MNWLMLTTVDVVQRPNNREHHLLRHIAPRMASTIVLFRRRPEPGGLGRKLIDAILPFAREIPREGMRLIAVNPPLNHAEGMVREATGLKPGEGTKARNPLGGLVYRLLGPVGVLKDIATILALAGFAMARLRRDPARLCTALGPWAGGAAIILKRFGWIGGWIYEDRDFEPGFVETPLRKRWAAFMERATMRRADAVITIGERLRQLRRAQTGREAALIPTGVDVARFATPRAGLPEPVLLYTGNVADWAGLEIIAAALPAIRARVPGARLAIAGSGRPAVEAAIRAAARAAGVEEAVTFLGNRPYAEMPALLAGAALGLATFTPTPLRIYAAPLKLVEYMAAGLPVLVTEGTEAADLATRAGCGRAVSLTPESIAAAAIALLEDRAGWARMAEAGREAAATLDWARLMEEEWRIMQRVATGEHKQGQNKQGQNLP